MAVHENSTGIQAPLEIFPRTSGCGPLLQSKCSKGQEKRVRVEHRSSVVCMSSYEANKQHIRAPPPCFADIQLRVLSNLYYGHVISKLRSSEKEDL